MLLKEVDVGIEVLVYLREDNRHFSEKETDKTVKCLVFAHDSDDKLTLIAWKTEPSCYNSPIEHMDKNATYYQQLISQGFKFWAWMFRCYPCKLIDPKQPSVAASIALEPVKSEVASAFDFDAYNRTLPVGANRRN